MNSSELNALIRDEFEGGESDPHVVAQNVLDALSPADYYEVLQTVLPSYTRVSAGRQRRRSYVPFEKATPVPRARPVFVPSIGWKDMSELNRDECLEIAAGYRSLAEKNAALATEYEDWADKLSDGQTLGELDAFRQYMSMRTKEGMAQAKAAGRHIGRPKPSEAIVLRIRTMRDSMTLSQVAAVLNSEGVKSSSGKPWSTNSVAKFRTKA